MSVCKQFGKDQVIFATKEDHAIPSTVELPETETAPGLILPNGEINWNCPCLGGMATGPCGVEFREAFSCFHYSEAEPKGSDCYDAFKTMQDCMSNYPTVYNKTSVGDDDDLDLAQMSQNDDDEDADTESMSHHGRPTKQEDDDDSALGANTETVEGFEEKINLAIDKK